MNSKQWHHFLDLETLKPCISVLQPNASKLVIEMLMVVYMSYMSQYDLAMWFLKDKTSLSSYA